MSVVVVARVDEVTSDFVTFVTRETVYENDTAINAKTMGTCRIKNGKCKCRIECVGSAGGEIDGVWGGI